MTDIIYSLDEDGIATFTFNRVEVSNAICKTMWQAIPGLLHEALRAGARLIAFTGQGPSFAAGADFEDLRQISDKTSASDFWLAIAAALDAISSCPLPTIAIINGHCLGGGCLLANSCDLRFAARSATFGIPVARLGIILDDINIKRLTDLVGYAVAKQMLFSGSTISATRAEAVGLINRAVEDEKLSAFAFKAAANLLANSSHSLTAIKAAIKRIEGGRVDLDQQAAIAGYLSDDFRARLAKVNK